MDYVFSLLCGALFGAGLVVGGMTDPAVVRGFLDLFGAWNPTLAFVMGGALIPMAVAWRVAARRGVSVTCERMPGPPSRRLDARLLSGAAIFGIGWGIAGYCPGPAVASLATAGPGLLIFGAAMLAGMVLSRRV